MSFASGTHPLYRVQIRVFDVVIVGVVRLNWRMQSCNFYLDLFDATILLYLQSPTAKNLNTIRSWFHHKSNRRF